MFYSRQLITDPRALILNKACEPVVGNMWKTIPALVHDMREVMKREKGLGLAANQIGVPWRLFVRWDGDALINPVIVELGGNRIQVQEACLSVPRRVFLVERREKVKVRYQNVEEKWVEEWEEGLDAQVIQHEMDHINGKIIDKYAIVEGKVDKGKFIL